MWISWKIVITWLLKNCNKSHSVVVCSLHRVLNWHPPVLKIQPLWFVSDMKSMMRSVADQLLSSFETHFGFNNHDLCDSENEISFMRKKSSTVTMSLIKKCYWQVWQSFFFRMFCNCWNDNTKILVLSI